MESTETEVKRIPSFCTCEIDDDGIHVDMWKLGGAHFKFVTVGWDEVILQLQIRGLDIDNMCLIDVFNFKYASWSNRDHRQYLFSEFKRAIDNKSIWEYMGEDFYEAQREITRNDAYAI